MPSGGRFKLAADGESGQFCFSANLVMRLDHLVARRLQVNFVRRWLRRRIDTVALIPRVSRPGRGGRIACDEANHESQKPKIPPLSDIGHDQRLILTGNPPHILPISDPCDRGRRFIRADYRIVTTYNELREWSTATNKARGRSHGILGSIVLLL